MPENPKSYTKVLLKILVSVLLLGFLFSKVDFNEVSGHISLMHWQYVPLIILLICANYVLSSVRWKKLLIFEGTSQVSVWYLTSLYFIGSFFNNFMPTSIGGDVYKIFKLGNKIKSKSHAFSATFMERFTGVLALVLISLVSLYDRIGLWAFVLVAGLVAGFFSGLHMLRILSSKVDKFKGLYASLMQYKGKNDVIVFAMLTSFLVQVLAILTQYFIFVAIGVTPPIMYSFFVLPVITLASFFIPSLNGIGVQDALYTQLFGMVGISAGVALSASILYHLFRLFVSLLGGVLYAAGRDE